MSLAVWLDHRAALTPDRPALVFGGHSLSYRALAASARRTAARLVDEQGIRCGDRVAYLGLNHPDLLVLLFACARLGAILVPLNWRLAPPEHLDILRDSDAALLFLDAGHEATAALAAVALAGCRQARLPLVDDPVGREAPAVEGAGALPLLIVYTSGTTGRPKGAVLTQDALSWNIVNATVMHDLTGADRVLTTLPLFHVGGLNIQTLPALHAGGTVHLHGRFDPAATLAAIAAERISLTVLVPAQLAALVAHPAWPATDLSSLRLVTTGSSIVPPHLITPWQDRGVPVIQVYGCTETAPIATFQTPAEAAGNPASCGRAALHCRVRVVGPDDRDLPAGQRGEILIRGPNVMTGYWRQPDTTAAALADGWFRSGDIGHFNGDGLLHVDDRKKEVIISGGENIYPAEVEAVLAENPDLAEAAVVGRADPRWGEVPVAVVVLRPGVVLDKAAVLRRFDGRLARFKHPRDVLVLDALPRNAMGKVLKSRLRDMV